MREILFRGKAINRNEGCHRTEYQIGFVFNGHEWRYSLRSTKVDCSKVAMLYGGGGHKGAAGFNTKECVLER